jgi:hypothetical protein
MVQKDVDELVSGDGFVGLCPLKPLVGVSADGDCRPFVLYLTHP